METTRKQNNKTHFQAYKYAILALNVSVYVKNNPETKQ